MSKLVRAGLEAITTIIVTLAIIGGAFSALLGVDGLIALSGIYYIIWAAVILVTHLVFARQRRHLRLSLGVATGVAVMGTHLVMFATGNVNVDINLVPVILHDFGFALVSMMVLNLVHLVIFRRRPQQASAPAAPERSERVDDIPAPVPVAQDDREEARREGDELEPEHAKSA